MNNNDFDPSYFLKKDKKLKSKSKTITAIISVVVGLALLGIIVFGATFFDNITRFRDYDEINAVVVSDSDIVAYSKNKANVLVDYEYEGNQYNKISVKRTNKQLNTGDVIKIYVNKADPEQAVIVPPNKTDVTVLFVITALILVAAFVIMFSVKKYLFRL